jgi:pimeloyl-ACP methyl ester carboxylesterase
MTKAEQLGLTSHIAGTAFGRLHFVGPSQPNSREVILMLHGFGSSWAVWSPLLEAAAANNLFAGRDVMAIDLPGFGMSENVLGHLDSVTLGRELLDLTTRLGYTTVRVAGHSMGGFLTLDMAARYPSRVASIHIVSGSYFTLLGMVNHPLATTLKAPLIAFFYWVQVFLSHHDGLSAMLNKKLARRPAARSVVQRLGLEQPTALAMTQPRCGAQSQFPYMELLEIKTA